ncbi:MAG: peptidylprolyl isomerase [Bacteroidia bacterium]
MKKLIFLLILLPFLIHAQTPITKTEQQDSVTVEQDFPGSEKSKKAAKDTLESIRQKVLKGEISFAIAAAYYSQDPGSAKNGGRYNNIARGQFVPEFESLAFSLPVGQVSEVFESKYGFHFLEVIDRHDDLVDVRHILIKPK